MRLFVLRLVTSALILLGGALVLYSDIASWLTQYRQSEVINALSQNVGKHSDSNLAALKEAKDYNDVLSAGADLLPHHNKPTGAGNIADAEVDKLKPYEEILKADFQGLMGRVKIDAIEVDLPIYHGTSESVLLRGVGHLQGTSFPIGGTGTHTVLTAHRGLAQSKLFTDLDQLTEGDTFVVEVFGEVLTYQVFRRQVVEPGENQSLRAVEGKDLATLVTCTPLGINSHRILVTGERIQPTPQKDLEEALKPSTLPHFPWWSVWAAGFLLLSTANTIHAVKEHRKFKKRQAETTNAAAE